METLLKSEDWKFCAVVELSVKLSKNEITLQFDEHAIRIFKPTEKKLNKVFVAEVYSQKEKYTDIETAYHCSLDILIKALARLSLLTYSNYKIVSPIGITQFKVKKGQTFNMLLNANFLPPVEKKVISSNDIPKYFEVIYQQEINDSISEIVLGINSSSIFEKYSHYYNSIERISDLLTKEKTTSQCPKCGNIYHTSIKATSNKMRELFSTHNFDNTIYKKCRALRAKLAHGACERTTELQLQIFEMLPIVEKIAFNTLETNTNFKIPNGQVIPRLSHQFFEISGKKLENRNILTNAAYRIISHKIHFKVTLTSIGEPMKKEGFITDHIPLSPNSYNTRIFPYAWPY